MHPIFISHIVNIRKELQRKIIILLYIVIITILLYCYYYIVSILLLLLILSVSSVFIRKYFGFQSLISLQVLDILNTLNIYRNLSISICYINFVGIITQGLIYILMYFDGFFANKEVHTIQRIY